jgi:uncharacterized membrane protein (UPF0127 family)
MRSAATCAGLALLALAASACGQAPERPTPLRQDAVLEILPTAGAAPIRVAVEIADSAQERTVGLMHRRLSGDSEGMLFVFPEAGPRAFWMRNTPDSLDLLFLDTDLRLVALIPNAEPLSDRILQPDVPAQYVLEVPGGFAKRHDLTLGSQVRIDPARNLSNGDSSGEASHGP